MPILRKILFPVDFSERAAGAARYVESIAGRFDAEVMLLHAVDPTNLGAVAKHLHEAATERIQQFLLEEFRQIATRRVCVLGEPVSQIRTMVRSWAPDIVMMPSYGLGFYRPALIGSVAAKVLYDVNCPVWTSPHSDQAPPLEQIAYRKILCAVDLGDRSQMVVDWATQFAKEYDAELGIAHATASVESPPTTAAARDRIGALFAACGSNGVVLVRGGDPAKTVVCAAKEFRADLLVIGRYSVAKDDGYLHHNAYGIIRESPCPVVSI